MCLLTSRGLGLELFLPWPKCITVRECGWTGDLLFIQFIVHSCILLGIPLIVSSGPLCQMACACQSACWEQLQLVPQVLKLLHEDVVASLMPQAAH